MNEQIEPIPCPNCGDDYYDQGCNLCAGSGLVMPAQLIKWHDFYDVYGKLEAHLHVNETWTTEDILRREG